MRRFHLALGYASLVLGIVGIVLPVLPTTPFIILAAWCFARSNPALSERLYEHPRFGALLTTWRDQRAIPSRAKLYALLMLALSYTITVWLTRNAYLPFILAAIMGSVALYIVTRPSPREMAEEQEPSRD
ncbi:membrane protein [Microvirga vignae]|uniref:Membrane protein n=1 Tax=Microvirga vignae TaxID=1225564 RepID=A0A0H1RAF8_9HYPH|nr:YbaN family protein [Microvirga vignae]KLK92044.1 membrane protein [Microvirga vignae]